MGVSGTAASAADTNSTQEAAADIIMKHEYPEKKCNLCTLYGRRKMYNPDEIDENKDETLKQLIKKYLDIELAEDFFVSEMLICNDCATIIFKLQELDKEIKQQVERFKGYCQAFRDAVRRPGLNGVPGVFVAREGEIIVEFDVDENCSSSDEELTDEMESDEGSKTADTEKEGSDKRLRGPMKPGTVDQRNLHGTNAGLYASQPGILPSRAQNAFLCQYCDMAFTLRQECTNHEETHDMMAPYTCGYCRIRSANRQTMINHIREKHDAKRPHICAVCTKGFCRRSDLKKHTIVHTGVRPFRCPLCQKTFSRNTNLTKHMRIHNSVKPHVCLKCPRTFSTYSDLMQHATSHDELKPFQCSLCDTSYSRKDKLRAHELTHERRNIVHQEHLANVKALSHNKEACLGANTSAFENNMGYEQNLTAPTAMYQQQAVPGNTVSVVAPGFVADPQQQQAIMPIIPKVNVPKSNSRRFSCDHCERSFTRERDLQRHQALHLDALFSCKECGERFNRSEQLQRHMICHEVKIEPPQIHQQQPMPLLPNPMQQQQQLILSHQQQLEAMNMAAMSGHSLIQHGIQMPVVNPFQPINLGFYSEQGGEQQ